MIFVLERGRLQCNRLRCIHARFDSQKVSAWPGRGSAEGELALGGTDKAKTDWLKALENSSETIVEVDVAGHGPKQFTFRVAGLVWGDDAKIGSASSP